MCVNASRKAVCWVSGATDTIDIDPLAVYAFFNTPQPTLLRRGRMVTPVEWLSSRADPAAVVELARHL